MKEGKEIMVWKQEGIIDGGMTLEEEGKGKGRQQLKETCVE